MDRTELQRRTKQFGANYRVTVRDKSKADFIYKIQIVLEEADETLYWLEVIRDAGLITGVGVDRLIKEANELTAIFAATDKTAKSNRTNPTS